MAAPRTPGTNDYFFYSTSESDDSSDSWIFNTSESYSSFLAGIPPGASTSTQLPSLPSEELFTDSEVAALSRGEQQTGLSGPTPLLTIPTPVPAPSFNWTARISKTVANAFDETASGWTVHISPEMREMDYWKVVFPHGILELLVKESNDYAQKIIASAVNPSRRQQHFQQITEDEMLRYLVIRILMGIDEKPELTHYWSNDPILRNLVIPQIMSSDRFFEIQRYLHLCHDNEESQQEETDKLHKVRAIWENAMSHFQSLLVPYGDLSVDESLTKFRGRLSFRQFIPTKRNRFGVKTFSIVDEKTKFVLNSVIYIGKEDRGNAKFPKTIFGHGGSVLLSLAEPYFQQNRTVYADNYFTSPLVAEELLKSKTYLCGTLRSGRKFTPVVPKLKKDQIVCYCCEKENCDIQVEYWKDKRIVRMISTGQPHESLESRNGRGDLKRKLLTIDNYNHKARGIDQADMFIGYYDSARKTMKWPTKVFFRLLELFIYNAYVMMRSVNVKKPFLEFRLNLSRQLLAVSGGISFERRNKISRLNLESDSDDRLTRRCFPCTTTSRRCVVCSKKGIVKRTIYFCKNCDVPLCAVPCFEVYHTKKSYGS